MATFRFEQYWHSETCCEVEAGSIEEALEMVKNGDCEWEDNTNNAHPNKHRYVTNYETPTVTIQTKHIDNNVWMLAKALHKSYVIDTDKVKNEMQQKIDACIQKMLNLQIMTKKIYEKIDRIEERVVYGKLSSDRADEMTDELSRQKKQYQNEYKKISEEADNLKAMLACASVKELPDYDKFTQDEKIDLIRQMISRVEIERKSRFSAAAYVYTKVDSFLYIISIDTKKGTSRMTSKMISDHSNKFH